MLQISWVENFYFLIEFKHCLVIVSPILINCSVLIWKAVAMYRLITKDKMGQNSLTVTTTGVDSKTKGGIKLNCESIISTRMIYILYRFSIWRTFKLNINVCEDIGGLIVLMAFPVLSSWLEHAEFDLVINYICLWWHRRLLSSGGSTCA